MKQMAKKEIRIILGVCLFAAPLELQSFNFLSAVFVSTVGASGLVRVEHSPSYPRVMTVRFCKAPYLVTRFSLLLFQHSLVVQLSTLNSTTR